MNNKGFTVIELLVVIIIISVLMVSSVIVINNTFGMTNEKSYEIFKKSIITQAKKYVTECDNELIDCENDYEWQVTGENSTTSFSLQTMKKYAYFTENEFINPVTNNDIANCLIINVTRDKYSTINVVLDDENCFG